MSMPVMFVGHGSPMNAIEHNKYTKEWELIGQKIKPKAILMLSAHWFTKGSFTQDEENPKIINDMYGFPDPLYQVGYQVKGYQSLTDAVIQSVTSSVRIRNDWGIDHGAWSVLTHMYPNKNIPVVQLSIDANGTPEDHYRIGQELSRLRDHGIFIIGSGNIVHNLRMARFDVTGGYDWNMTFDAYIKEAIESKYHHKILTYDALGDISRLAVPSTDHFDPLLYILGATKSTDRVAIFNEDFLAGSLSMTSYLFE